ncbi:MAG: CDP-alcohol phosphatidyltransferase family protein [Actinomycetota bacterium]
MSGARERTPIFDRDGTDAGSDAILTVPNLFTFLRLLCVPLFLWMVHGAEQRYGAAVLLAVLGATDWVDGYLARLLDQRSQFGRVFDPTVDRLMFLVALISMVIVDAAPAWFLIAVFAREALVSVAALYLGARGLRTVQVSWWGKTATFGLMFALPLFLAASAEPPGEDIYRALAWIIGLPSLALSWWSGFGYVPLLRPGAFDPETGEPV